MAQEIVSLGFHVNEEHGEMFTGFYEIFMDQAVIDMLINSRKYTLVCFLVILVFPIGTLLSTSVCLPCPGYTRLLIITIYSSFIKKSWEMLEHQSAPSSFIFIQIKSSCC